MSEIKISFLILEEEGDLLKITKGMVDRESDIVVIPNSIKEIEDYALMPEDHTSMSYFYHGTKEEWDKAKLGKINNVVFINFLSGNKQLAF